MPQYPFTLTEFLAAEVKPALGCTEPGAVALAILQGIQHNKEKEQ